MAVVHVSTFAEFRSAIGVTGDTVIVDSDMDANGVVISSAITFNATQVQGNGHTLYNLYGTGYIFQTGLSGSHTFTELNFANIDTSNSTGALVRGTASNSVISLTKCSLQGNIKQILAGNSNMSGCSVVYAGTSPKAMIANMSYATLIQNCFFDFGNLSTFSSAVLGNRCNFRDCYFKGAIKLTQATSLTSLDAVNTYNNVFNSDLSADTAQTFKFYGTTGGSINVSIYNADKIGANVTIGGTNSIVIPLTDAQMHDASEIAAVGFPIIV